jgi:hypothetical protein
MENSRASHAGGSNCHTGNPCTAGRLPAGKGPSPKAAGTNCNASCWRRLTEIQRKGAEAGQSAGSAFVLQLPHHDAEDVRARETGEETVLLEGQNLDDTAPVRDPAGRTLAAIGSTISGTAGGKDAMLARAKELTNEVAGELRTAKLW